MKHYHDYTVLTTHTKAAPLVQTFNIDKGLITWAGVYFRAGCNHCVKTKLFFQSFQILPRNQESWCHGNMAWRDGYLYIPVSASPLQIKVIAWEEYAAFDHVITVGIELKPFPMVADWARLNELLRTLGQELGMEMPPETMTEMNPEG